MNNISFNVNSKKAIETIVYITNKQPNISHYFLLKIIFYSEKKHLNEYGKPIFGDKYFKMPHGPVPSLSFDIVNLNSEILDSKTIEDALQAFTISQEGKNKLIASKRKPDLKKFSEADLKCLNYGISFCKDKTFSKLREISHKEKAWIEVEMGNQMDYALLLDDDNPMKDDIIQDLEESSVFMVF